MNLILFIIQCFNCMKKYEGDLLFFFKKLYRKIDLNLNDQKIKLLHASQKRMRSHLSTRTYATSLLSPRAHLTTRSTIVSQTKWYRPSSSRPMWSVSWEKDFKSIFYLLHFFYIIEINSFYKKKIKATRTHISASCTRILSPNGTMAPKWRR